MRIISRNRKAEYQYDLDDKFDAGLVLKGTEVKSIKNGKASISEAYCVVREGEVFIKNMYIKPSEFATYYNHEPRRRRKLLLHKHEINKLARKTKKSGYTIIPIELFVNESGWIKIVIALAKGRHEYDKKRYLQEKDAQRRKEKEIKEYFKRER